MVFPGVLKKEHVEIPGVNLKRSGISMEHVQEKLKLNFHGPWLLTLGFSRVTRVTQFCRISRGESLFSAESRRVNKVTNVKIPDGGRGLEKYILSTTTPLPPSPVWIFFWNSGIALIKGMLFQCVFGFP